jgi:4-amino-4-deoxy-L-arabinose transferase-like glycosyltransferase
MIDHTITSQEKEDFRNGWKPAVLISFLIMCIYLFMGTRTTLWDRDEPRFTRATVEMIESGNYLVPTFNGQMWADKPILFYWFMSVPIRLFGPTEFACRFWAGVGTAVTSLLTFFIGQRLFGAKSGLWAMVILASTLLILGIGTMATIDAVLLPIILAVMAIFVQSAISGTHISYIILAGIALGAGMLAKGPMGLQPIVVIAVTLWLGRKAGLGIKQFIWQFGAALIIGGLIFLAWAIPANNATHGEFFRVFIGRHVLTRAIKPMEHHGGNFLLYLPYYLNVVIIGFFPWILHLPGAISVVLGGRMGGRYCRALLISWVVPIFIIMTLAATKLPHYILFIWPAMALMVGGTIVAAQHNVLTERDRIWLRRGVWSFGPFAIAAALVLMIGPWFVKIPGLRWSGLASGIVLSIMAMIAIRYQRANRPQASAVVLLIGMIVFEIPILFGLLPAIEQIKMTPAIARAVKAKTAKEIPVATYKFGEPTLNFYIGRQIEPLSDEKAVVSWSQQPGEAVLIIPKDKLDSIQQSYGALPLEEIASKKGFNYSKGKIVELMALIRNARK